MNIGKWSVTRPVAVTMRIAALGLLGFICLLRTPIDLLPKIDIPTVAVSVSWPNTPPETMETQITRPLEQAAASVPGLFMVSSTSQLGSSFVRVQLNYGVNVDQATLNVIQQVQRAVRRFPNDPTITPPSVFKFDPNSLPILSYGVTGDPNLIHLRDLMDNTISPILQSADGVAQVNVSGGYVRSIIVDADPKKLQAFGLSMTQISQRISAENLSLPAGQAIQGNTQYTIRAIGYFDTVDQLRKMPFIVNGKIVTLGQVADVKDATQDTLYYVRMGGYKQASQDSVNVSITKQLDANTVDVANAVRQKIQDVQKTYPNLKFRAVFDQSSFVEHSIDDLKSTAIFGGVLAIIIITFFLRNLRSTFVVALSIPISIVSTFSLIYFCGFTLNTISLSGLALASGLIVDDAIVVLENIYRHIERDKKRPVDAAVSGTHEIIPAVMASTFTVMIVFLPLLLIKGQTGQTFTQFALVVVFAMSISLLDATTVVPMLCSRMIRERDVLSESHPEMREQLGIKVTAMTRAFDRMGAWFHGLDTSYRKGLHWAIYHRLAIMGIALLAIVAAGVLYPFIGKETLPQTDTGNININVKMPIGTSLAVTDKAMRQIEADLQADPDVDTYISGSGTNVGLRGAGSGGVSSLGGITLQLKDSRKSSTNEVLKRLQKEFAKVPGARVNANPYDIVANLIGGNNFGLSVDMYGQDYTQLTKDAHAAIEALDKVSGLEAVDMSIQDVAPEIQWKIDRDKAQTLGVSFSDVANTLGDATNGQLSTYFIDPSNGNQYPIYVQVPRDMRLSISQLEALPIEGTENRTGGPVRLNQVAAPIIGTGPNQIQRQNFQRFINVGGRVADRPQSEVQADMESAMNSLHLPEGEYWTMSAQYIQSAKDFSGLGLSVFLAVALIYMLLATQFESFVYPLIVLCSVPLCAIGLVLALFLTGRSFGLTAFIGLLMLIGIVVKNGILLVDYTNQLRSRGMPRDEAILTAAPTRLRPILMTTLAAILGMMPLALGLGTGSEMYVPLATSVIGGLATSTMLTLFIVPTVYTLFDDLARKMRKDTRDLDRPILVEPSVSAAGGMEPAEVHE